MPIQSNGFDLDNHNHGFGLQEGYSISNDNLLATFPDGCFDTSSHMSAFDQPNLSMVRTPTRISGDSFIDKLIHHYIVHMSDLLQPISHPQNPDRTLYVPAALEVASDLPFHQTLSRNVKSVLYHSLIASSALHLWNCNPMLYGLGTSE
jgi:hypothetical protein